MPCAQGRSTRRIGRLARFDEIAPAVLWLRSPAAASCSELHCRSTAASPHIDAAQTADQQCPVFSQESHDLQRPEWADCVEKVRCWSNPLTSIGPPHLKTPNAPGALKKLSSTAEESFSTQSARSCRVAIWPIADRQVSAVEMRKRTFT